MTSPTLALPKLNESKKFWITFGILVWLYFVLSNLPAIWGAYAFTRGGNIAMSGVSGTLWSGRASLASVRIKEVDYSLGQLTWKLNILSLFTLKPCALITTQMDNQNFDGNVCFKSKNGILMEDVITTFPAKLAQPLLPVPIDGQLSLNLDFLNIENGQLVGVRGKVGWMDARIYNGANWMALGGLGADVADDGKKGLTAHIVDVNSPIHVDLTTTLPFPAGGSVKGTVSLPEPYFRELNANAWLSMFAVQQPNDAQGNVVYMVDLNFK